MNPSHSATPFRVRPAAPRDVPEIHAMIGELADFEKLREQFTASESDLAASLFGEAPPAGALVAAAPGDGGEEALIGYAIYFTSFSTFLCRAGLWLEDLYVRPAWRGRGAGKALFLGVVDLARQRDSGRCEWTVLDWNQRAIQFYETAGAEVLPDWRIARLDGAGMERLAPGDA